MVCDQCGETWIQDGVAERLEQMVEDARVKNPVKVYRLNTNPEEIRRGPQ